MIENQNRCIFAILNDPPCIVTKTGRIFAKHKGQILERKQSLDSHGYLTLSIKHKTIPVHKLVAKAFLGEKPLCLQIDHIDRNKTNNSISNLRYVTAKENIRNRNVSDKVFDLYGGSWSKCNPDEYKRTQKLYFTLKSKKLEDDGMYETTRIINGKRTHVVLPIKERKRDYKKNTV